ncbi:MAG: undecaprenyldiphospho-muramoylpentapeptide beta-N-acetylglucosaminyltransferase [Candidatus Omnitrophica bacterium]|nr:undecaprenyldiphospho-muramoylpentapeptide beta-N-acetylglucosaminyltransferase [Candidatus Omnitrophota bacterium]
MERILVVGGGSGGHLFPAFALVYEMQKRKKSFEIMFVISGRAEEKRIANYIKEKIPNIKILIIPIFPFKRGGFCEWFRFISNTIRGVIYSFLLVLLSHPRVVVGFGGILSLPLILSAFLLRIPTLVHEQNVYPGKANRLLSYFANVIAVSFEDTKQYLRRSQLIFTGNPLRPDLLVMDREKALSSLGLEASFFTILILGGSQGANVINNYFLNLCEKIIKENIKIQIIHLTGLKDLEWVAERYKKLGILAKVFPFYEDMGALYSSADLVIGRAGASTLNELSFFAKPAVVIPYPYAEKHQFLNALYYSQRNSLFFIDEKDLNQEKTYYFICDIIKNKEKRHSLSEGIKKLNNSLATKLLADTVEGLLKR